MILCAVLRKLLFLEGNKVREGTVGSDAGASRYEYQPFSAIEIEATEKLENLGSNSKKSGSNSKNLSDIAGVHVRGTGGALRPRVRRSRHHGQAAATLRIGARLPGKT